MSPSVSSISWPWLTRRLLLRPVTTDDAAGIHRVRSLPQVQWFTSTGPLSQEAVRRRIETNVRAMLPGAEDPAVALAVIDRADGRVCGDARIGLHRAPSVSDDGTPIEWDGRLAYTLHPSRQGIGLGGEVGRALLEMAFGPLGLRRVVAMVFADNEPSARLLRRLGLREEGRHVAAVYGKDGCWWDDLQFAMLREEWNAGRRLSG